MTEISDAEAAEVLWASSEQGAAAVKAAWGKAKNIGLGTRAIDAGDIGAIVYAAYLAAGWGADPAEDGHLHTWVILAAQEVPPAVTFIAGLIPRTAALASCQDCGQPTTWLLDGIWTMEDLRAK